ncbi:MAG: hypothetical protein F6J90_32530 [Moorea sp. SIOASIH]|uniref:hypothetical protein n=1 Tax=Moorena sp. SIOASIH TaxID=2607817 RepID=UPI0013BA9C22|nr:hypothetical protein [Moorena sp. SIOASIH]NEO40809.1 hypothetical protein [Moorena sp. SIOASIH]
MVSVFTLRSLFNYTYTYSNGNGNGNGEWGMGNRESGIGNLVKPDTSRETAPTWMYTLNAEDKSTLEAFESHI